MKTLGLIGGTTWLSTIDYYRIINQRINDESGGINSARLIMYSVNFAEFNIFARTKDWKALAAYLISISAILEKAGAEGLIICANTPHIAADDIEKAIGIPLIHIAVENAKVISGRSIKKAGLLGTRFTMEENFYKDKLLEYNIEALIPEPGEREFIHNSIFNELGKNIFTEATKSECKNIINRLTNRGAEGIILGCTEIPLLIKQEDCSVPVFDTTQIHAEAAVKFALEV